MSLRAFPAKEESIVKDWAMSDQQIAAMLAGIARQMLTRENLYNASLDIIARLDLPKCSRACLACIVTHQNWHIREVNAMLASTVPMARNLELKLCAQKATIVVWVRRCQIGVHLGRSREALVLIMSVSV